MGTPAPTGQDPVAVVAVGMGFLGIVFLGILLAFVDGVVRLAMHYLFRVPIWIG